MDHHAGYDPGAEPRFWFVLDVAIAHEPGHLLAGLRPERILPARPLVLAACRARAWAIDRRRRSKSDAATWATAQLADSAPVAKALARRADPATPGPTPSETAAVLDPVERLLAAGAPSPRPGLKALAARSDSGAPRSMLPVATPTRHRG